MNQDLEHLRLLSIFHYVLGGLAGLFACIPCIHLVLGIVIASGALDSGPQDVPRFVGVFLIVIAATIILFGWTIAIAVVVAGRCLSRQTHYTYCLIVAAVECLFIPCGTVLGVFTILVLNRGSVRELFQSRPEQETPGRNG